jgi:hypothetical protein
MRNWLLKGGTALLAYSTFAVAGWPFARSWQGHGRKAEGLSVQTVADLKHAVVSSRYSQANLLRTIEDILGTEHLNLNTYYARPMADAFATKSSGKWTFQAVASTLLQSTTLFPDPTKMNFAAGPVLKPTHNAQYWAQKTRGFDFSGEDRVPAELYNKILWEGLKGTEAPASKTRFSRIDADDKDGDGK